MSRILTGKEGASAVLGRKRATPEMIERPDTALTRYAHLIARDLHVDVLIWQAAARQAAWGGVIRVLRRAATAWY